MNDEMEHVRLLRFTALAPASGWGRLAAFDVEIGPIIIRGLHYHRNEHGRFSLKSPRLERTAELSVELPKGIRRAICRAAHGALAALGQVAPSDGVTETKPAISTWLDRHEGDDAGLKRALAA